MEKSDWLEGIWSAIPVGFWIAFGFYAGPKMTPYLFVGWLTVGALIIALTWWQSARGARDSRLLKQTIAEALGIDSAQVSATTDFKGILARKILELENKVSRQEWRTITPQQRTQFADAMPKDRRIQMWCVWCAPADAEAASYTTKVLRMFVEGGVAISDPDYFDTDSRLSRFDKYGLVIVAKDTNVTEVQILKKAFDAAGVECALSSEGFEKGSEGWYALRIGPKPE
jgi:hypothetical protein